MTNPYPAFTQEQILAQLGMRRKQEAISACMGSALGNIGAQPARPVTPADRLRANRSNPAFARKCAEAVMKARRG